MGLLLRLLPTRTLRRRYIRLGAWLGNALSYAYMGKAIGFDAKQRAFDGYENEWVRRGHHAWTMDEFIDLGGYGRPLPDERNGGAS